MLENHKATFGTFQEHLHSFEMTIGTLDTLSSFDKMNGIVIKTVATCSVKHEKF